MMIHGHLHYFTNELMIMGQLFKHVKEAIGFLNEDKFIKDYYFDCFYPLLRSNQGYGDNWDEFRKEYYKLSDREAMLKYLRHIMNMLMLSREYEVFFNNNYPEYSSDIILLRFFNKSRLGSCLAIWQQHEELKKEREDLYRKEYTLKRVFAYKYENFVYSLYSPLAYKRIKWWEDDKTVEYSFGLYSEDTSECLPKEFILEKMVDASICSVNNASSLFDDFVNNELIREVVSFNKGKQVLEKTGMYRIGSTLDTNANIISENDMNITKWIEINGQPNSKEQLMKEVEPFLRNK